MLAIAACGTSSSFEVHIEQITPAAATNLAPIPVQLAGTFARGITHSIDDGNAKVSQVEVLVDDTPLTDVVWQDEQRIDATIPAGITPGRHDIVVRIGERSDTLEGGFAITGAALTASLSAPSGVFRDSTFQVTMTVTNTGITAADAVKAASLISSGTGTATLVMPPAGGASIAPGASTDLVFDYMATGLGPLVLTGHASAVDSLSQLDIASPDAMTDTITILEATTVIPDPFGDGSPAGYLAAFAGHVYVGPDDTGESLAQVSLDGSTVLPVAVSFEKDTTGNPTGSSAQSYASIGFPGCTESVTCGPDNEDGRGLFTSGVLGNQEWLLLAGARSGGDFDYIYMTTETSSTPHFLYVDLDQLLTTSTRALTAAHFLGGRLYLGLADTGPQAPNFLVLTAAPQAPGLDATTAEVIDLQGAAFAELTSSQMIDSMGDINGLLYVANAGGVYAARSQTPSASATSWASATPTSAAWTAKTPVSMPSVLDLRPGDLAIPQFAPFSGRLFMARNTTNGPQLWECDPSAGTELARCEPTDWVLAAPNTAGDTQLTQFDNTSLTRISMVVATSQWLYVGFDSASGVQVYRTSNVTNLTVADFEGQGGCKANVPGCQGIGGTGLGDATNTHIFDATPISSGSDERAWISVGNGTKALQIVIVL